MRFDTALVVTLFVAAGHASILPKQHISNTEDRRRADVISTSSVTSSASSAVSSAASHSSSQISVSTTSISTVTHTSGPSDLTAVPTMSTTSISPPITTPTDDPEKLPIVPTITPAMGIAGVLLMVAGIVLAVIGVKNKQVHVFLSTACLTSLAVTVLILYVMNPPVSNAIQGAYLSGAVVTGLVLGSLAMVFHELTEGLSCLLGGFCFAMWLLVLRDGGLIDSTAGRAILIAVFSLVAYALSFSNYTRGYALLVLTSFAGAEVAMLGIDCFSRAGLKEFWIYLWNLNDNEFPLGTNTYPITRGIRVEIACTILIFLVGLLSQSRNWKVRKERKERENAEQRRDDEHRDQMDRVLGARLESKNQRELQRWESVYGEKGLSQVYHMPVDSARGSSARVSRLSLDGKEKERGDVELSEMARVVSRYQPEKDARIVPGIQIIPSHQANDVREENYTQRTSSVSSWNGVTDPGPFDSRASLVEAQTDTGSHATHDKTHEDLESTTAPRITPLPFRIPTEDGERTKERTGNPPSHSHDPMSPSDQTRSATETHLSANLDEDDWQINLPHMEDDDDKSTSIAALGADDIADLDTLSQHRLSGLPIWPEADAPDFDDADDSDVDSQGLAARRSYIEEALEEEDEEAIVRPPTATEHRAPSVASRRPRRAESKGSFRHSSSAGIQEDVSDAEDGTASVAGSLAGRLPSKMTKAALTYRTNEWAKHIADAAKPDDNDGSLGSPTSPGVKLDSTFEEEVPIPVDVKSLSQETSAPAVVPRSASALSSRNPYRSSTDSVHATVSKKPSRNSASLPTYSYQPNHSQGDLRRSDSGVRRDKGPGGVISKAQRDLRNVEPLIESPAEAVLERVDRRVRANMDTITPKAGPNVGARRMDYQQPQRLIDRVPGTAFNSGETRGRSGANTPVYDRPASRSQTNLNGRTSRQTARDSQVYSSTAADPRFRSPSAAGLARSPSATGLARSPSATGLNRSPSAMGLIQQASNSTHALAHHASNSNASAPYNSRQPRRGSSADPYKAAEMRARWRESLDQDHAISAAAVDVTTMQQQQLQQETLMMASQRAAMEWEARQRVLERTASERAQAIDTAMRSTQMHVAHREKLRQMQAGANAREQGT